MNHSLLSALILTTGFKALAKRMWMLWAVLKEFAPYAAIEIVLPGGTVLAVLCWLYQRRRFLSTAMPHQARTEMT